MILSDIDIIRHINNNIFLVNPFNPEYLQPASVDLHLNNDLMTVDGDLIDISNNSYFLKPNEFILGSTIEKIKLPQNIVGHVDGRSSIGRLGILVHVSAGYIDPCFEGNVTLELCNLSNRPFELKVGQSLCQIIFEMLSSPCQRGYGHEDLNSKYQNSNGTVRSKL